MRTIEIPERLARRIEKLADATRRKPDAVIQSAIESQMDYEEWLLKALKQGIQSADRSRLYSTDELKAHLAKHRAKAA